MTTFTSRDSKFWADHYNKLGKSNDENLMHARKSLNPSEFAYIFNDINKALQLEQDDIVADVGCASGAISILFSSMVKKVFSYDIAQENINYCKESHFVDNVEFACEHIERVKNSKINKMFLGAVLQHFSEGQLSDFAKSICSAEKFPNIEKVFISHIPNLSKQHDWLEGYKNFISSRTELEKVRQNWKSDNTWYDPSSIHEYFGEKFDVIIMDVDPHITQHKYCFDMLLKKKHKK